MNSKPKTPSQMRPNNLITTFLFAVSFIAASLGQADAQTYETYENYGNYETYETVETIGDTEASSGWVRSLNQAVAESESTGKPIMFVFSGSDWCSYCQVLEQQVFNTPEFESWSSQNVIKVMVDFPKHHALPADVAAQNENLKAYFADHLRGYPTILLVRPDGTVLGKSGFVAGGPMAWIAKTDPILRPVRHRFADTSYPEAGFQIIE